MDRARIAALAREVGLDEIADQLADIALAGFSLSEIEDDPRVGGHRVGGCPSLPDGASWPVVPTGRRAAGAPMCFIAQIELSGVPDWLLPGTGLLSLWCDGAEPWGPGAAKAIVFPAGTGLRDVPWPPGTPSESPRGGRPVELVSQLMLPGLAVHPALALESLDTGWDVMDEAREGAYFRLCERLEGEQVRSGPRHRLGGHADHIQGDPLIECVETCLAVSGEHPPDYEHARALAPEWRLLLQDKREWGDGGSVYFCLPAEDLASARFGCVQVTMQSC